MNNEKQNEQVKVPLEPSQMPGGLLGGIHAIFHGSDLGCAYGGMTCTQRMRLQQLLSKAEAVRANRGDDSRVREIRERHEARLKLIEAGKPFDAKTVGWDIDYLLALLDRGGGGQPQWTREFPHKADAGDSYYFVKRIGSNDIAIAGFSMGKMWVNGNAYEPAEINQHEFLGPLTPESFINRGAGGQWRPIESLAAKERTWYVVARIKGSELFWWYRAHFVKGIWRPNGGGVVEPTHYLPLPSPPSTEQPTLTEQFTACNGMPCTVPTHNHAAPEPAAELGLLNLCDEVLCFLKSANLNAPDVEAAIEALRARLKGGGSNDRK